MEKPENVIETFRDKNYELTSINEAQNTIVQIFKQKFLIRENQLKKRFFTPFTVSYQRNPKFFDPEQFGGIRDKFEFFKFNMKAKFKTNDNWYFTAKKINYAFSRLKNFVQNNFFC